jgi:hypothetical protein
LKVTLDDIDPPIWRRLEIPGNWPIDSVATALRQLFGWSFDHVSVLTIKRRQYGDPTGWVRLDPEQEYARRAREIDRQHLSLREESEAFRQLHEEIQAITEANEKDEDAIPLLHELVKRTRAKFKFRFDLGDCWDHTVEVEKISPPEPGVCYPRCTGGERADPFEDIGGAWRQAQIIEIAKDPAHPARQEGSWLMEWLQEDYDPEAFPLEKINRRLGSTFRRAR